MTITIITTIINSFFYSLSFFFPVTFDSYNSFAAIFNFNQENFEFTQGIIKVIFIIFCLIMMYILHRKELRNEHNYIFHVDSSQVKSNRFFLIPFLANLTLIPIYIFQYQKFAEFNYLIFFISIFLISPFLFLINAKRTKVTYYLSRFDSLILLLIIGIFNFMGSINATSFIILYLFYLNYSWQSISIIIFNHILISSIIYLIFHYWFLFNFSFVIFFWSLSSFLFLLILYFILFKSAKIIRAWISAISFVTTIIFILFYL